MSADEEAEQPKKKRHRSVQACLECRRLKLRCHTVGHDGRCARCAKRDLRCEWASAEYAPRELSFTQSAHSPSLANDSYVKDRTPLQSDDDPLSVLNEAALRSYPASKLDSLSDIAARQPSLSLDSPTASSSSLKRRRSQQQIGGWTSARLDEIRKERIRYFSLPHAPEPGPLGGVDAVQRASLSDEDVERLFTLFFGTLNRQTPILDPQLHRSWRWVRARSHVLLLVILAISATADKHPRSIRPAAILSRDMEESISTVILSNIKSLEIAQALMLAYLFPSKTSHLAGDRSWLLIDTASRILTDLRIGVNMSAGGRLLAEDCSNQEQRNGQRTYLASLVLEKSLSTFVGAKRQRRLDLSWEALSLWTAQPTTYAGDVQLVAFLQIRRLEHDVYDRLNAIQIGQEANDDFSSLCAWSNSRFEQWKNRWADHRVLRSDGYSRNFTLLVGLHIQLLLNIKLLHAMQALSDHKAVRSTNTYSIDLACNPCRHFLRHFGDHAHQLCRNPVAMVVSSALMLLQLDSKRGLSLCWDVALAIAGNAEDANYSSSYGTFLGQTLLSIVNDIDSAATPPNNNHSNNRDAALPTSIEPPSTSMAQGSALIAQMPSDHSSLLPEPWDPDAIQQYIESFLSLSGAA